MRCSTERRVDGLVAAHERFDDLEELGRIPIRRPFDPSEYLAFPIDQEAGREALNLEGLFQ